MINVQTHFNASHALNLCVYEGVSVFMCLWLCEKGD